jgi:hypothetical protein
MPINLRSCPLTQTPFPVTSSNCHIVHLTQAPQPANSKPLKKSIVIVTGLTAPDISSSSQSRRDSDKTTFANRAKPSHRISTSIPNECRMRSTPTSPFHLCTILLFISLPFTLTAPTPNPAPKDIIPLPPNIPSWESGDHRHVKIWRDGTKRDMNQPATPEGMEVQGAAGKFPPGPPNPDVCIPPMT